MPDTIIKKNNQQDARFDPGQYPSSPAPNGFDGAQWTHSGVQRLGQGSEVALILGHTRIFMWLAMRLVGSLEAMRTLWFRTNEPGVAEPSAPLLIQIMRYFGSRGCWMISGCWMIIYEVYS